MRIGKVTKYDGVLSIPEGKSGRFKVTHKTHEDGHRFQLNNVRSMVLGGAHRDEHDVVFDHATKWHMLTESESVWMTDYPVEQSEIDVLLSGMSGRVLVGGLGLGYAVTALAAMKKVKSIAVVEKNQQVIDLVWKHLGAAVHLKAEVVCMDLFHFLRTHSAKFDFGFYDIWASDGERTFHGTVVPLRKMSRESVGEVRCWHEDVMRGQMLTALQARIFMLSVELPGDLGHRPSNLTVKALTTRVPKKHGGDYINWAIPFWQWYEKTTPDRKEALLEAKRFVAAYGM